jgi:hypothetical protein
MTWEDGHSWSLDIALPPGHEIAFKVVRADGGGELLWEEGVDRTAALPAASSAAGVAIECPWSRTDATAITGARTCGAVEGITRCLEGAQTALLAIVKHAPPPPAVAAAVSPTIAAEVATSAFDAVVPAADERKVGRVGHVGASHSCAAKQALGLSATGALGADLCLHNSLPISRTTRPTLTTRPLRAPAAPSLCWWRWHRRTPWSSRRALSLS